MISEHLLARIMANRPSRLVVGYSGGLDSHVLLHVATTELDIPVCALHINHGLSARAQAWQAHCADTAHGLGADFVAVSVVVSATGSLEENARRARYEVFESFLKRTDVLLLAHHADDQVETVLLSLFRGSARPGVTGMPVERVLAQGRLIRPLIDRRRSDLEAYAERHGLRWIEDESNLDPGFDRNYIRHHVLDIIRGRWPGAEDALLRAVSRDDEFSQLIDSIAESDLHSAITANRGVPVARLTGLPAPRRHNLVRYWLGRLGLPLPSTSLLKNELDSMTGARDDATPLLSWQGVCIRRFNDVLYVTGELPDVRHGDLKLLKGPMQLPVGTLSADMVKGRGMRRSLADEVIVRFRKGGERLRLMAGSRTLKNLFHERGVPPWLRDHVPLIFIGDELVAIAGLPDWNVPMLTGGAAMASDDEKGVELSFSVPNQPYS